MSLSWLRQRLGLTTIHLGRDHLRLAGQSYRHEPGDPGEAPWAAAADGLAALLAGPAGADCARRLRLVLANDFVRYLVVPWNDAPLSEPERGQLARALFAERYGERERAWRVVIDGAKFGRPSLAAAMDEALAAHLAEVAAAAGRSLVALVPALAEAWNRAGQGLAHGWAVDLEEQRLAGVAVAGARLLQVSNERIEGSPQQALEALVRRDIARYPALAGGELRLLGGAAPGLVEAVGRVAGRG